MTRDRPLPPDLSALIEELRASSTERTPTNLLALREKLWGLARAQLPQGHRLRLFLDSEDLAQDAFWQLAQNAHVFRGSTWKEFFAFVRSLLAQQKVDLARHHGRQKREEDRAELADRVAGRSPSTPSEIASDREDRRKLQRLICELPDPLRQSLELRLAGQSYEEIAGERGISLANAKQRVSRALRLLRERWRRNVPEQSD